MSKHSTSTVLGAAVLGLALVASPAFAANLFTVNQSRSTGVTGSEAFVPAFISSGDSDGPGGASMAAGLGIYIPYLGTMRPCTAQVGSNIGDCSRWGQASIQAWANGLYYDPRFGTPFIPPSGDHHRTGYRMLMQPSFSGGAWLTGFAPLNQRFPFFPEVGSAGPGGDVGLALASASAELGLNGILALTDAHGEPLTTGKFPRYWPHERQAWVDTLMVKYTAGGTGAADFTQSLRSQVSFSREATKVRWRAMSNLDGHFALDQNGTTAEAASSGCGASGWCEFYVVDTNADGEVDELYVTKNADGNTDTTTDGTTVQITESTRVNTMQALTTGPDQGKVLKLVKLNALEMLPSLIEDRLAQTDTADQGGGGQTLMSQFRVYSGPNVHSEEGADPYAFVICGSRGHEYAEDDCNDGGGAIDGGGVNMAIVYNSNFQNQLGDSVLKRMGRDLNPARFNGGTGNNAAVTVIDGGGDPDQTTAVFVACAGTNNGSTIVSGITYQNSTCESSAGGDGMYGTADDGTIYYKEAIENGLRGWIRETNGHSFSFLGADDDGAHNGTSPANFGLTQLVEQNVRGDFLMSCLNCSPHRLPVNQETVTYTFDWPKLPTLANPTHPPAATKVFTVLP